MPSIHFMSGLPRSGSTLLAAILRQNPAVHARITSPVGSMVGALRPSSDEVRERGNPVADGDHRYTGKVRYFPAEQAGTSDAGGYRNAGGTIDDANGVGCATVDGDF